MIIILAVIWAFIHTIQSSMKHLTIALCGVLVAGSINAQRLHDRQDFAQAPQALSATETITVRQATTSSMEIATRGGGTVLFQEDFSNGFDGNNTFGAWTAEDTGGGTIWQHVGANGYGTFADGTDSGVQPPAGEFSATAASLASTSGANGWMVFDCDYYNTPIASGVENTEGWLVSPVLDFTNNTSVVVSWEQYFRYCCYPFAPIFLEVSNDGGNNWITFDGHGSFIESANTASANPLTTSVDISCAAAGQSMVQIRFSYLQAEETGDGYSHYFWGIDDVVISENTVVNDLQLVQLTTGDVFNVYEYTHIPFEQRVLAADGGLIAGVLYRNNGNTDQEGVEIIVDILDDAGTVLSSTTETLGTVPSFGNGLSCPSNPQDTIYIATGWEPTALGTYTVQANIMAMAADEVVGDNSASRDVTFTEDEYGHDDATSLNVEFRPRAIDGSDLFEPAGYGNFYHMQNDGSMAYGLTVRFGPNSGGIGELEFETRLYTLDPALGLTDSPFESTYWSYNDEWTPASVAASEFVYLSFEDPIAMDQGNFYFGGVIVEFEAEAELTVLGNSNSDTDNSTGSYSQAGSGDYIWFTSQTSTPAVRLITSERVGVDQIANANGIQLFQNTPNPTNGTTTIRFEMLQSRSVAVEIRDLQGRLVESIVRGQLPAGEHQVVLDTDQLNAGIYTYTLVADGMRLTKKMVVR
jgi:hypothetical protein